MKVHGVLANTLIDLQVKINEWVGDATKQRKLAVDIKYAVDNGIYSALIIYND